MSGNQPNLLNQHQLAAKLRRSRASIVTWGREGMPIAKRGGPGRPTLYDYAQVCSWIESTGRGMRPTLPPMPLARGTEYTLDRPDVRIPRAELLLGRVLETSLGCVITMLVAHGVPDEAALAAFDGIVVAAYTVLEELNEQDDSLIPMDGALLAMETEAGRASLLEFAHRAAEEFGSPLKIPRLANAMAGH